MNGLEKRSHQCASTKSEDSRLAIQIRLVGVRFLKVDNLTVFADVNGQALLPPTGNFLVDGFCEPFGHLAKPSLNERRVRLAAIIVGNLLHALSHQDVSDRK